MGLIKIGKVAKVVGRTPRTIKNWYAWAEETNNLHLLPKMHTDVDKHGSRYFDEDEVQKLVEFKNTIQYGTMAEFNSKLWGQRGKDISKKKEELT